MSKIKIVAGHNVFTSYEDMKEFLTKEVQKQTSNPPVDTILKIRVSEELLNYIKKEKSTVFIPVLGEGYDFQTGKGFKIKFIPKKYRIFIKGYYFKADGNLEESEFVFYRDEDYLDWFDNQVDNLQMRQEPIVFLRTLEKI